MSAPEIPKVTPLPECICMPHSIGPACPTHGIPKVTLPEITEAHLRTFRQFAPGEMWAYPEESVAMDEIAIVLRPLSPPGTHRVYNTATQRVVDLSELKAFLIFLSQERDSMSAEENVREWRFWHERIEALLRGTP